VEGMHSDYTEKPWPSRVLQHTTTLQYFRQEWTKFLQTLTYCLVPLCGSFS